MKQLEGSEKRIRGWIPKGSTYSVQSTRKLNADGHFAKIALAMRLVFGLALAMILVTPFGVYHSRVEPYIVGSLWGYNLPIGYIGLALGLIAILFPKTILARKSSLGVAMVAIGVLLIGSLYLVPREPFINWVNGTSFNGSQIDIDFAVGNIVTLFIGILSIITGLATRTSIHSLKKNKRKI